MRPIKIKIGLKMYVHGLPVRFSYVFKYKVINGQYKVISL